MPFCFAFTKRIWQVLHIVSIPVKLNSAWHFVQPISFRSGLIFWPNFFCCPEGLEMLIPSLNNSFLPLFVYLLFFSHFSLPGVVWSSREEGWKIRRWREGTWRNRERKKVLTCRVCYFVVQCWQIDFQTPCLHWLDTVPPPWSNIGTTQWHHGHRGCTRSGPHTDKFLSRSRGPLKTSPRPP